MSLTKVTYSMIEGAVVNVLDFGAVGDGITDDRAAIQAAIDYAESLTTNSGGVTIYFPKTASHYRITSKHPVENCGLLITKQNLSLQGEWTSGNHLDSQIRMVFSSGSPALAGLYVKGSFVSGLSFDGITIQTSYATNAAYFETSPYLSMKSCRFCSSTTTAAISAGETADNGLKIDNTFVSSFDNVWTSGKVGFRLGSISASTSTSCTFTSCFAIFCKDYGWQVQNYVYSNWISCAADGASSGFVAGPDNLTAYYFDQCFNISVSSCGCENVRQAIVAENSGLVVNDLFAVAVGATIVGNATTFATFRSCWGSVGYIRFGYPSAGRFYSAIPFEFRSFNSTDRRLSITDPGIPRSLIGNGLGPNTNINLYYIGDDKQYRTYQFVQSAGTVLTIPIVSQALNWIKHSLHIRGVSADIAGSDNPRPFETTVGFRSLTSLADITSNNAYGITSVTASGMNLIVTLANAINNVVVTIDPLYADRYTGFRQELIDFDNITFS
jgi:hypothetical protein